MEIERKKLTVCESPPKIGSQVWYHDIIAVVCFYPFEQRTDGKLGFLYGHPKDPLKLFWREMLPQDEYIPLEDENGN